MNQKKTKADRLSRYRSARLLTWPRCASAPTAGMDVYDYRRHNPDYLRGEGSVLLPATDSLGLAAAATQAATVNARPAPLGPRELPRLWLFFLPLYWFPQRINWGLIGTFLIPFQLPLIVGDKRKHMAYSM